MDKADTGRKLKETVVVVLFLTLFHISINEYETLLSEIRGGILRFYPHILTIINQEYSYVGLRIEFNGDLYADKTAG